MDEQGSSVFLYLLFGGIALLALFVWLVPLGMWISAIASGVHVPFTRLISMRLRRVNPMIIIRPMITARVAGLSLSCQELEAHYLAGGNVENVVKALIVAQKRGIEFEFSAAAALDLAGRDVAQGVREGKIKQRDTSSQLQLGQAPLQRRGQRDSQKREGENLTIKWGIPFKILTGILIVSYKFLPFALLGGAYFLVTRDYENLLLLAKMLAFFVGWGILGGLTFASLGWLRIVGQIGFYVRWVLTVEVALGSLLWIGPLWLPDNFAREHTTQFLYQPLGLMVCGLFGLVMGLFLAASARALEQEIVPVQESSNELGKDA